MDVCIVRHAIAEARDAARWANDAERPLTNKGAARFRAAARGLRRLIPEVGALLSSPYVRAWQTAEILTAEAGWPEPRPCPELEAVRGPGEMLTVLAESAGVSSLALVGHEPHLSSLASLLLAGESEAVGLELKKGGALLLSFGGMPGPGAASLRWSLSPKILRWLDEAGE